MDHVLLVAPECRHPLELGPFGRCRQSREGVFGTHAPACCPGSHHTNCINLGGLARRQLKCARRGGREVPRWDGFAFRRLGAPPTLGFWGCVLSVGRRVKASHFGRPEVRSARIRSKMAAPSLDLDGVLYFKLHFYSKSRLSRSQHDPADRVGTSRVDSAQAKSTPSTRVSVQIRGLSGVFGPNSGRSNFGPAMDDPHPHHPIRMHLSYPPGHTQCRLYGSGVKILVGPGTTNCYRRRIERVGDQPTSPKFGRHRAGIARIRPKMAALAPEVADFAPNWSNWPPSPTGGQGRTIIWPTPQKVGRIRGRMRNIRPKTVEDAAELTNIDQPISDSDRRA